MFSSILDAVVTIAGTLIIILMVIFLIKDVVSYLKGQGTSLLAILAKVGAVLLIVAIIFLSKTFASKGSDLADGVAGRAVDGLTSEIDGAIP